MHRVTIQYDVPQDPEAFDERYFDHHVQLVAPIPGLHAFTWSKPRPLGGDHSVYLVAQLDFDDADSLKAALSSAEMGAVGADAAAFRGEVRRFAERLAADPGTVARLGEKRRARRRDEQRKPLGAYRAEELARSHECFFGADRSYHEARRRFVHKTGNPCAVKPTR